MAERYNWGFGRVALAASTAKSIASLTTPSTRRLWIRRWTLTFDGTPNAQAGVVPVKVEFFRGVSLAGAVWTATPPTAVPTDPSGVAALHTPTWNATTEPTSFAAGVYLIPPFDIPPTNGLIVPNAVDANWLIPVSSTFVCRVTPGAAAVDVSLSLELEE
jgi:hypothetical protein